jgi:hypothetical protein
MYTQKYNELTLTASAYNRKTSIELPCDSEMGELVDAFEALVVGLGYSLDSWKDEIMERGEVFKMQELRNQKDMEYYTNRIAALEEELHEYKMKKAQDIPPYSSSAYDQEQIPEPRWAESVTGDIRIETLSQDC